MDLLVITKGCGIYTWWKLSLTSASAKHYKTLFLCKTQQHAKHRKKLWNVFHKNGTYLNQIHTYKDTKILTIQGIVAGWKSNDGISNNNPTGNPMVRK